jgi:Fe-S cluster assembly protein SufD
MTDAPSGASASPIPAPTEEVAPAAPNRATRAGRGPRRSPGELTFRLDETLVRRWAADEPDWLAADRLAALDAVATAAIEPNVLYTIYVDLRAADLAEVRAYETTGDEPEAGGVVPEGASALAEFRDDRFATRALDAEATVAGVRIETFGALLARDPATARALLAEASPLPANDRVAQTIRAGWNQAVVIDVPDGIRLERPIVLRWVVGEAGRALLTRTLIRLGRGASALVVEEIVPSGHAAAAPGSRGSQQALLAGTTEVILGPESTLVVAGLQEAAPHQVVLQHRVAAIGEGATMTWALGQLGSRLVRSRIDNRLEGDRSSIELVEIVFGSDDQLFDLTSYTNHIGRDATSNLLSKAVLQDRARTFLKGLVTIEKTGVGTDSFLGEYGMNLSRQARAVAIPSLEIDQPDCRRVAHSSTVGPIDESQLFYLETRGIPPGEARKFIVLGFLEPVVARVPLESARERLRELLEAKWDAAHRAAEAVA